MEVWLSVRTSVHLRSSDVRAGTPQIQPQNNRALMAAGAPQLGVVAAGRPVAVERARLVLGRARQLQ